MTVFAIRRGKTARSLSGQHTPTTDISLTDNGRRLADRMRPVPANETFAMVLGSPLQRARETCTLASLVDKAVLDPDPDLAEWNCDRLAGLRALPIHQGAPGWVIVRDRCPGGGSPEQVGARAGRVIARAERPTVMWCYSPMGM